MMGYVLATGSCVGCRRLFSFNPLRVPSCSAVTGSREPICQDCVDRVNPVRIANGLAPIVPLPGAYDAAEKGEL
jgi:hypothetical protein